MDDPLFEQRLADGARHRTLPLTVRCPARCASFLLPILLSGACNPEPEFDVTRADALQEALDELAPTWGAPGATAAVIDAEGAIWVGASGTRDVAAEQSMRPGHVTKAGSTTKTVVAVVVLQLVEEGVLSLDDPVSRWWDGLPDGEEITVRNLLQHTSGLPAYLQLVADEGGLQDSWTTEELLDVVADEPRLFEPGSSYAYANTNYVLLGLIAELSAGRPWDRLVEERVFAALELEGMSLPDDWGAVGPGYLVFEDHTLYEPEPDEPLRDVFHPSVLGPAGALVSDAESLARFGRALWGDGELLTAESTAAHLSEAVEISDTMDYGLGVVLYEDDFGTQYFHNGAVTGYVAWVGHRPDERVTLALMANAWLLDGNDFTPDWNFDASASMWEVALEDVE